MNITSTKTTDVTTTDPATTSPLGATAEGNTPGPGNDNAMNGGIPVAPAPEAMPCTE
jgi:hypothetical protein